MLLKKMIGFLYPQVCILCGKKIIENESYACEKCFNIIKYTLDKEIFKSVPEMYFDKLIRKKDFNINKMSGSNKIDPLFYITLIFVVSSKTT